MRIEKSEKIYLSQNEADIWTKFEQILEDLEVGSENVETSSLVDLIQNLLDDLWKILEVEWWIYKFLNGGQNPMSAKNEKVKLTFEDKFARNFYCQHAR